MKPFLLSLLKKYPAFQIMLICVAFILIEGLYSFCSKPKKVDCPAFSDTNFESWFPYQDNQALYFTSSLQRKDTITIQAITKSTAYQGTESVANCDMYAQISSKEQGNITQRLFIAYSKFQSTNNLNFVLYDFQINGSLTESGYVPGGSEKAEVQQSAVINGQAFSNLVQIQRDTALYKQEGVYKVWLSKQKGLVGYERYPTQEQFVKH